MAANFSPQKSNQGVASCDNFAYQTRDFRGAMAWTETYHCDVCGIAKNEDQHDWWLAFTEVISAAPHLSEQPVLRLTPWNRFLSHSSDARHFCGARCAQTGVDRWMTYMLEIQHLALAEKHPG
jgi:hypothetical protein